MPCSRRGGNSMETLARAAKSPQLMRGPLDRNLSGYAYANGPPCFGCSLGASAPYDPARVSA